MTIREKLVEEIKGKQKDLRILRKIVNENILLDEVGLFGKIELRVFGGFLVRTKTYRNMYEALKRLRDMTGSPMPLGNIWYSCEKMLFSWSSEHIELWLECDPDDVPEELMPSKDCKVERQPDRVEERYALVCPVGTEG